MVGGLEEESLVVGAEGAAEVDIFVVSGLVNVQTVFRGQEERRLFKGVWLEVSLKSTKA